MNRRSLLFLIASSHKVDGTNEKFWDDSTGESKKILHKFFEESWNDLLITEELQEMIMVIKTRLKYTSPDVKYDNFMEIIKRREEKLMNLSAVTTDISKKNTITVFDAVQSPLSSFSCEFGRILGFENYLTKYFIKKLYLRTYC